jgi:hypothetical protein
MRLRFAPLPVSPINSFVELPKGLLVAVCMAFLLVVSPQAGLTQVAIVFLGFCGAVSPKIHKLGLSLMGIPGLVALVLTDGTIDQKSLAALLAMFEFYALEQLLWGLGEEAVRPWLMVGLVWLLLPSALGLLGMGLLFVLCHQRWNSGLASVRHTQKHNITKAWWVVASAVLVLVVFSQWLPQPRPTDPIIPELPRLTFGSPTNQTELEPNPQTTNRNDSRSRTSGLPLVGGVELVACLMLLFLYFAWRRLKMPQPFGKASKPEGMLWVGLMVLTGVVSLVVLFNLGSQNRASASIRLPFDSGLSPWIALLFFLAFFIAWRISQRRLKKFSLQPEGFGRGLEGLHHLLPENAVRAAYSRWLIWLRDLELRRSPTQTPHEFLQMVSTQYPKLRPHSQTLTHAYEKVRYGNTPSQTELEQVLFALEQWRVEVQSHLPQHVSLLEGNREVTRATNP